MAERRAKCLKALSGVGSTRNVSQLHAVLKALSRLEDRDEVLAMDKNQLQRAIEENANDLLITLTGSSAAGGSPVEVPALSFTRLMQRVCRESSAYRDLLRRLWLENPTSSDRPLHLVFYGDEVVPGNVLRLDNGRKVFVCFVTVKEFGPIVLSSIDGWLPLFVVRANVAKQISGGLSACMRELLSSIFIKEKVGRGIALPLELGDQSQVLVHFAVSNLVLDGDALRQVFSSKGAAGKLPCLGCLNVLRDDENELPSDAFVTISDCDASRLELSTSRDIWAKADMLHSFRPPRMLVAAFEKLQIAVGLTYEPESILYDHALRPHLPVMDILTYDTMHILLCNGMADDEFRCLFTALEGVCTWADMRRFLEADFKFSRQPYSKALVGVLSEHRENRFRRDGTFSPGASETLMLYPVLTYFLDLVVSPKRMLEKEIKSFKALGCIIGLVKEGKCARGDAAALSQAIAAHGRAHFEAYGASTRTKPHWLLHIPLQLQRDGWILDCFVGERCNLGVKAAAKEVRNLINFETSVLRRVISETLQRISDPNLFRNMLVRPQSCPEYYPGSETFVSEVCMWNGTTVRKDDVVFVDDVPVLVIGCMVVDGVFFLVHHALTFMGTVAGAATRWRRGESTMAALDFLGLRLPAAWHLDGDTIIILFL